MDTTPLTSTPSGTPERRMLGALAVAAGAVLVLSACGGPVAQALGRPSPGDAATYATGADAKAAGALPEWVPDDATDVRVEARSGGAERIVSLRAALADLPATCVAVTAEQPLGPRPVDADPADFRSVSTLQAQWWPAEVEQRSTTMCGEWWVGEQDGTLYAFTPERRTVPVN
jgi:hypothetical protein